MFKNYLKIALRNMAKQKLFMFINISGLMLGICCCLLVFLYLSDELSYDKFHENQETLYRVVKLVFANSDGSVRHRDPDMVPAMAGELTSYFSEIKHQTLFAPSTGVVRYKDRIFPETIHLANTPFFQMFSFPLLQGSAEAVFSTDNAIVLTRSYAEKYFGKEDPMGETLSITYGQVTKDYCVTGIAEDTPNNSSIRFDLLIPISNLPVAYDWPEILNSYDVGWHGTPLFIQLRQDASVEHIEQKFNHFTRKYFAPDIERWRTKGWNREGNPFSFGLQPIKSVYLDSSVYRGKGMASIYILAGIAVMVLIIACINFTNLTLGMSTLRSTEIGIRKVVGAEKKQLVCQFWGESVMMAIIALIGGIILAYLFIPMFNSLSGKQIHFSLLFNAESLLALAMLTLLTGMLAGSYPAFVMAGFRPVEIMKGKVKIGGKSGITKALVVFQFVLSVGLILSALLLGDQLSYLIHKDLGYEKEGLIVVRTQEGIYQDSQRILNLFRNKIISHPDVKAVTACNAPFGLARYPRSSNPDGIDCHYNMVDSRFVETLGLQVIDGRDFIQDASTPADEAIVNESFVRALELDLSSGILIDQALIDRLGMPEYLNHTKIVGVLEDFHFSVLTHEIFPAIYHLKPVLPFTRIFIRISTENLQGILPLLEDAWKEVQPEKPFVYYFQDNALEGLYNAQKQWSVIVQYTSILSVLIACMGILGLTAIMISRRVKEIGIRKVLGARMSQLMILMMKEFVVLIAIANVIAWPIAFLIIQKVLQNFPYRISIGIHYFLITGLISLLLAVLTILYLVLKSATANPVKALKYE